VDPTTPLLGAVWADEHKEPDRCGAIFKIIRAGMDTRQVVTRLEARSTGPGLILGGFQAREKSRFVNPPRRAPAVIAPR